MTRIRIGTRGSQLAQKQTQWVCNQLNQVDQSIEFETVIIRSQGDLNKTDLPTQPDWPVGAFTGALERALLDGRIDVAVHSHKDLPTANPEGLTIAAIPRREAPHDVLICRSPVSLEHLPANSRIGTASPRRTAQLLQLKPFKVAPIRGNVPSRIEALRRGEFDAIVLAAAGLNRLGVRPPHAIDLPVDRFVPAPAQGALAVQTRDDFPLIPPVSGIEDPIARKQVTAERAFLAEVSAGCRTAAGALANVDGDRITLFAQLFTDDFARCAAESASGIDPQQVGMQLGQILKNRLQQQC